MKIGGITLYPFIILRERYRDNPYYQAKAWKIINHESIHLKQQIELLILPFYILYVLEYIVRIFIHGGFNAAYRNISFEKEAKRNEDNKEYLNSRKPYSFVRYYR